MPRASDLVVAKYTENISWLQHFMGLNHDRHAIFVYDKSDDPSPEYIALPNIGREAHTFLEHIIRFYDDLADVTVFVQGNPFDHHTTLELMSGIMSQQIHVQSVIPLGDKKHMLKNDELGFPDHKGLQVGSCYKAIFGRDRKGQFEFMPGAQYAVTREAIRAHPLDFWMHLLGLCFSRPEFPWEVERLWMYIYGVLT